MHYLVDGHNLIARLPDIDLSDPHDEIKLVLRLRGWASARRGRRVTLYFDGGLPGGESKRLSSGDMRVVFASAGRAADPLLIAHINRVEKPHVYTLVTSDRAIIAAAEARRMPALTSDTFAAKIVLESSPPAPAPAPADPGDADEPRLSESEVAEWLALFGPVPERPPPPPRRPVRRPAAKAAKPAPPRLDPAQAKHADYALDADEVATWLRLFGLDEAPPPPEAPAPPAAPSPRRRPQADDDLSDSDRAAWDAFVGDDAG